MSAKRKYRNTSEYLKYLEGELSGEERHAFERDLQADPFEMEALEGMEQVPATELEEDLLSLHASLHKRLRRRRRRTLYYVAASVASLLIIGTLFLNIYDINPEKASESIPRDESFLHEDAGAQSGNTEQDEVLEMEEPAVPIEIPVPVITSAPEETKTREEGDIPEETPVREETEITGRRADAPTEMADALKPQADAPKQQAEVLPQEDETEADELVVMEAQPGVSRKIGGVPVERDQGNIAQEERAGEARAKKMKAPEANAPEPVSEPALNEGMENQAMQFDSADLDEVVMVESVAANQDYPTGAVQKVNIDNEDIHNSGAEPEGGLEAFKMYIEEQIRFPAGDTLKNREVVVLTFHVGTDGSISRFSTLRSPGPAFTEEAIRLVREGPSWKPARNENGLTEDVVRMRIVFKE